MSLTECIGQSAKMFQCVGSLAKHLPRLVTHRIDNEMGMDVLGIGVGGNEHLAVRPSLSSKILGQLVRLFPSDRFLGMERLDVVVEPDRTIFVVHLSSGHKLLSRQLGRTVLTTDQPATVLLSGFLCLRHISRHAMQRPSGLLLILDKCDRSHQRFSCPDSSCSFQ